MIKKKRGEKKVGNENSVLEDGESATPSPTYSLPPPLRALLSLASFLPSYTRLQSIDGPIASLLRTPIDH